MQSYQPTIHRYQPAAPRLALGLSAIAISAVLLSIFVVVPASVDTEAHEPAMVAMALRCAAGM